MSRRKDSLDMQGRVGESTWYADDGRELVRVPFRYTSILGRGDASLIVSSVTCRTAAEVKELRAAVNEACTAAEEHVARELTEEERILLAARQRMLLDAAWEARWELAYHVAVAEGLDERRQRYYRRKTVAMQRAHYARCEWQRLAGLAMPLPTPDQIIGCLADDLSNRFCNLKETDPEVELDAEEPEDD